MNGVKLTLPQPDSLRPSGSRDPGLALGQRPAEENQARQRSHHRGREHADLGLVELRGLRPKARLAMNSDIVKPIPASRPTPIMPGQLVPSGSRAEAGS